MNYKKSLLLLLLSIGLLQCAPAPGTKDQPVEIRGVTYDSFTQLTNSLDSLPAVINKSWKLWKAESWGPLETFYEKNNYNWEYPPAQGFISVDTVILASNTKIDRYGRLTGYFVAPTGTPFGQRSLPASSKSKVYYRFNVVKDIPGVLQGPAIPWFTMPGKGRQYMMPKKISQLISEGYIAVIDSVMPKGKLDKYHD